MTVSAAARVGVYLRETRRTNRDGSVVCYLQLAHNTRSPESGVSTATVIHDFGRAEQVDRAALARLVSSISRFLNPAGASTAAAGAGVEVLDSRRRGGAWTVDQLWSRLGIGAALRTAAAGRKLDAGLAERVVFALVAQRTLDPGSELACFRARVSVPDKPFVIAVSDTGVLDQSSADAMADAGVTDLKIAPWAPGHGVSCADRLAALEDFARSHCRGA